MAQSSSTKPRRAACALSKTTSTPCCWCVSRGDWGRGWRYSDLCCPRWVTSNSWPMSIFPNRCPRLTDILAWLVASTAPPIAERRKTPVLNAHASGASALFCGVAMIASPFLANCDATQELQAVSAGQTGCEPQEIEITDDEPGLGARSWVAWCTLRTADSRLSLTCSVAVWTSGTAREPVMRLG